ncbi:MAG: VCBS repeat-containing protein, partial [Opitutaceae bacterium]
MKYILFFAAALAAGAASPVIAEKPLGESIALGPPEVIKVDWNTRALTPADLSGNGLTDLAVLNNDRAQIDLLYQLKPGVPPPPLPPSVNLNRWEPVVADAHFKKISLTTGVTMFDLAIGDLNGDGRPDLVYTGDPQALTIRYQKKNGDWTEKIIDDAPEPSQLVSCLAIADLAGHGRKDLVMLGKKELAIFYQDEKGVLRAPERYALSDENCYGLQVCDVNGDGRPDLVYLSSAGADTLRVRLQAANGQFGPEQSYPLKALRSTLQLLNAAGPDKPAKFAYIQDPTGQLVVFELDPKGGANADKFPVPRPRIFTPRAGSNGTESYAFGDFDGDGREDIAVSDPEGSQIYIYFRQADGGFTVAKRFPSLSDGRSIAAGDWDGSGRASLFVASPKEQVVGVTTVTSEGRLTYPQPLPVTGKPFAVATGDLAGTGHDQLVVALSDKGKYALQIWAGAKVGQPQLLKTIDLPNQNNDPRAVRVFDANQDGKLDIAVFTPFEPMRLFVQGEKFSFKEATSETGFRPGLVDNLDSAALTVADVDGKGRPEMLVSGTGYARALRLKPTGELAVLDQFNANDPSAEIAGAFALPPSVPGKKPVVVLYDQSGQSL